MTVPLALLGLLEREPSHGYDLKRDYDAYFGRGKPLPFGQVYSTLARLARDGKVVVGEAEPGGGPGPQALRHHRGRRRARSRPGWPSRWSPSRTCRPCCSSRSCSRSCSNARPSDYLDTQRAAHLQRMRELTELKRTGDLVDALLADHGLFHLEADLRWIDLTAARLDELAEGGAADEPRLLEADDVCTCPSARRRRCAARPRRSAPARSSP